MKYKRYDESIVSLTGSRNKVKWLIEAADGSANFEMREITIPPSGHSSEGSHPYEHGVFVLSGNGSVKIGFELYKLIKGVSVYVAPNEQHQWINDSQDEPLRFICVIPTGSEDFLKDY